MTGKFWGMALVAAAAPPGKEPEPGRALGTGIFRAVSAGVGKGVADCACTGAINIKENNKGSSNFRISPPGNPRPSSELAGKAPDITFF